MSDLYQSGIRPYLEAYLRNQKTPYPDYWRGSSAGYCYRYNIFKRLNLPEIPELEDSLVTTQSTFHIGHAVHKGYQEITAKLPENLGSEGEIKVMEWNVVGHYDDLFEFEFGDDKPMTHKILYDYKTVSSRSFNYPKEEMSATHKMQLSTYIYGLRKEHPDLAEGRILEISKDDGRMREFQLIWNIEVETQVRAYWDGLEESWEHFKRNGALPECTCAEWVGDWMARRSKAGKVYNPYFLNGEPCSKEYYELVKGDIK